MPFKINDVVLKDFFSEYWVINNLLFMTLVLRNLLIIYFLPFYFNGSFIVLFI